MPILTRMMCHATFYTLKHSQVSSYAVLLIQIQFQYKSNVNVVFIIVNKLYQSYLCKTEKKTPG